jgi:hypothetical protein
LRERDAYIWFSTNGEPEMTNMNQFREDNTDGYNAADLTALNAAWSKATEHDHLLGMDDWARSEHHKYLSTSLLAAYDKGLRDQELLNAAVLGLHGHD